MKKISFVSLIVSIIGFMDSVYLTVVKLTHTRLYCTPGLGNCETVQNSQWSTVWGIPIALLGAVSYLVLIICFLLENKKKSTFFSYLIFGISFFGFIYSMYLTWLEFFVIHEICQWCILSALCMTFIFITTIVRLNFQFNRSNK